MSGNDGFSLLHVTMNDVRATPPYGRPTKLALAKFHAEPRNGNNRHTDTAMLFARASGVDSGQEMDPIRGASEGTTMTKKTNQLLNGVLIVLTGGHVARSSRVFKASNISTDGRKIRGDAAKIMGDMKVARVKALAG